MRIHTREGKTYTGLMTCQAHSIHVFKECRTMERNEDSMMILLDEKVSSKEDVVKLGIRHGDPISPEPRCQFTESGFLKSRFIDDKAAVACCFTMPSPTGRRWASAGPMYPTASASLWRWTLA